MILFENFIFLISISTIGKLFLLILFRFLLALFLTHLRSEEIKEIVV